MSKENCVHIGKKYKWPAALAEIYDIISISLKKAGYEQEACQAITGIVIKGLSFMAGGRQFYLPSGEKLDFAIRDAQIYREFTGNNIDDLVRKHRLSTTRIYEILRIQRELARENFKFISENRD